MEQTNQESSRIVAAAQHKTGDIDLHGLVVSPPPPARRREPEGDGKLGAHITSETLHPTQANADMFLALKARLEVCVCVCVCAVRACVCCICGR